MPATRGHAGKDRQWSGAVGSCRRRLRPLKDAQEDPTAAELRRCFIGRGRGFASPVRSGA